MRIGSLWASALFVGVFYAAGTVLVSPPSGAMTGAGVVTAAILGVVGGAFVAAGLALSRRRMLRRAGVQPMRAGYDRACRALRSAEPSADPAIHHAALAIAEYRLEPANSPERFGIVSGVFGLALVAMALAGPARRWILVLMAAVAAPLMAWRRWVARHQARAYLDALGARG
ncbi:MAG TPA: hypothetical protein VGJ28_10430 [Micromonosporaceae bacterium]|jgi:hypothetical protein